MLHLLKVIDNLEPTGGMSDAEYEAWKAGVAAARGVVAAGPISDPSDDVADEVERHEYNAVVRRCKCGEFLPPTMQAFKAHFVNALVRRLDIYAPVTAYEGFVERRHERLELR